MPGIERTNGSYPFGASSGSMLTFIWCRPHHRLDPPTPESESPGSPGSLTNGDFIGPNPGSGGVNRPQRRSGAGYDMPSFLALAASTTHMR